MKIRTESQLFDTVDADLIWRKKELTQIKFLVESSSDRFDRRVAMLRSAVPVLYAHWEGFIRAASLAYLEYVASQRLAYQDLSPNFLAIAARKQLNNASSSTRIKAHLDLIDFLRNRQSERSNLPYDDGISTRANLSSEALREIVDTLGLDFSPFESRAHLIDEALLRLRNTIAHGEYLVITQERYDELSKNILEMMENYRTQVQNAAVQNLFRAS